MTYATLPALVIAAAVQHDAEREQQTRSKAHKARRAGQSQPMLDPDAVAFARLCGVSYATALADLADGYASFLVAE
jgi:hypothetical protein